MSDETVEEVLTALNKKVDDVKDEVTQEVEELSERIETIQSTGLTWNVL